MTTFSTYDYRTKRYTYYRAPGDGATHAGAPNIRSQSDIGAVPEGAAWRLPSGAVKVGSGLLPQGRIASMGEFVASDSATLGLLALAAFLAWKVLR